MSAPDRIGEFTAALRGAFADGSLLRLKLGGYHGPEAELKSAEARKVAIKAGERLSLVFRYKTRDITKNLTLDEAEAFVAEGLSTAWRSARLETTGFDLQFERQGDKLRLKRTEVDGREAAEASHDRTKNRPLTATAKPWLKALGLTGADGKVLAASQDKFRQINKMVEIFAPLIQGLSAKDPLIVDMGRARAISISRLRTISRPAGSGRRASSASRCARGWCARAMRWPRRVASAGSASRRARSSTMTRAAPMR